MPAYFPSCLTVGSILGCALSCVCSPTAWAQVESYAKPAPEIRFEDFERTSRRNPLDQFQLHETPRIPGAEVRRGEVQLAAAVGPQPPAVQPPAIKPPAVQPPALTPPALTPPAVEGPSRKLQLDAEQADEEVAVESNQQATDEGKLDGLVPVQSRSLQAAVSLVSISMEGIGTGLVPEGQSFSNSTRVGLPTGPARGATYECVAWQPTLMQHQPLYYEEAMLERHGHVRFGCLQPLASGVRFFATAPLAPYLRMLRPKNECNYVLGQYRAGSCAPLLHDTLPYDKHAAVAQTLASAAYFWALPL